MVSRVFPLHFLSKVTSSPSKTNNPKAKRRMFAFVEIQRGEEYIMVAEEEAN